MSLVKIAAQQKQEGGIAGWTKRHPYLAGGIALTGGIAAADMGLNAFKYMKGNSDFKSMGSALKHGAKEGALYGGILSTVEPLVLHGALKKKPE